MREKDKFPLDFFKTSVIIRDVVRSESAGVAQSVERLICNQQVGGSNPSASSIAFSDGAVGNAIS